MATAVKAFFRYLRGELLNGFYIKALNLLPNKLKSLFSVKEELMYWVHVKFKIQGDVDDEIYTTTFPITFKHLQDIAWVAGVINFRGLQGFTTGMFRLVESHIVPAPPDGYEPWGTIPPGSHEYSDRALFDQVVQTNIYERTDQNVYDTDITELTIINFPDEIIRSFFVPWRLNDDYTPDLNSDFTPKPILPVGFVYGEASLVQNIDPNGMIPDTALHPDIPPKDTFFPYAQRTYGPWYGDKYLPLFEDKSAFAAFDELLLYYLLIAHQKIKFNGLGLLYLLQMTEILVKNVISNLQIKIVDNYGLISQHIYRYELVFDINTVALSDVAVWSKFAVWEFFIRSKYPYIHYDLETMI